MGERGQGMVKERLMDYLFTIPPSLFYSRPMFWRSIIHCG